MQTDRKERADDANGRARRGAHEMPLGKHRTLTFFLLILLFFTANRNGRANFTLNFLTNTSRTL